MKIILYNIFTYNDKLKIGESIKVSGVCSKQIFYNEENDFGIYIFNIDNNEINNIKVSGNFGQILIEGASYTINGKVSEYKNEKQIKANTIYPSLPKGKNNIIAYLRTLKRMGLKAFLIYDMFKNDSIKMLIEEPKLVASKIDGVGIKSALLWKKQLTEMKKMEDTYIELLAIGIKPKQIDHLIKTFGDKTVEKVKSDPYCLIDNLEDFSFNKADKIALDYLQFAPDNNKRLMAGITYALEKNQLSGHCYSPKLLLIPHIINILSINLSYTEMLEYEDNKTEWNKYGIKVLINQELLKYNIAKYNESYGYNKGNYLYSVIKIDEMRIFKIINIMIINGLLIEENDNLYLKEMYTAEKYVAEKIKIMTKYKEKYSRDIVEKVLDEIILENNYELEYLQREACILFNQYDYGVFILGGGAGRGKTFTLNLILKVQERIVAEYAGENNIIKIVTPTGKASKVATIATGRKSSTIHRTLCTEDLEQMTTIICDETSMLDLILVYKLLAGINKNSKLIFIGDVGQIPSIGPGNVLKDFIDSGIIKSIFLQVPKRQYALSGIDLNATRILENQMIRSEPKSKDFYILKRDNISSIQKTIIESIKRILCFPNYNLDDIQVLSPQRKGPLGINMLNYLIQKEFNKTDCRLSVLKEIININNNQTVKLYIKKEDKVIHIKNNYNMFLYKKEGYNYVKVENKTGIFNGESGIVEDIIFVKGILRIIVKYDDYFVFYDDNVDELELAYATTVHKSQGSSSKATIVIVTKYHFMWSNNLLYTALTRATNFTAVIGDIETINNAIHNHTVSERFTTLKKRLML